MSKNGGLPPLLVWVPLLIVNNYFEFQINIFSNNRDIRKCQSFHTKILSRKRGISLSEKIEGLPPLLVWVPLLIGNNYFEFQVNIISNNRDIRKCQSLRTKILSRKRGTLSKKIEGLPPLLALVPLLTVNNDSEFQVNIFGNNRDIRQCQSFRTTPLTTTPLLMPGL